MADTKGVLSKKPCGAATAFSVGSFLVLGQLDGVKYAMGAENRCTFRTG